MRDVRRAGLIVAAIGAGALGGGAIAYPRGGDAPGVSVDLRALAPVHAPIAAPTGAALSKVGPVNSVGYARMAALEAASAARQFDLAAVRRGERAVPRLYLERLPGDYSDIVNVARRKHAFMRIVLPLVLRANEEIAVDRRRLLDLRARARAVIALPPGEVHWLHELAARYGTTPTDWPELVRRVDAVSPALALAQAAEESGWGTSRFARAGNAVFGQWSWRRGSGLVPKDRTAGRRHEVRRFADLLASARAYAHNLNSHPAYGDFRALRARMRAGGGAFDATVLAGTLERYSARRGGYVKSLRLIVAANRLGDFEAARLEPLSAPGDSTPLRLETR